MVCRWNKPFPQPPPLTWALEGQLCIFLLNPLLTYTWIHFWKLLVQMNQHQYLLQRSLDWVSDSLVVSWRVGPFPTWYGKMPWNNMCWNVREIMWTDASHLQAWWMGWGKTLSKFILLLGDWVKYQVQYKMTHVGKTRTKLNRCYFLPVTSPFAMFSYCNSRLGYW